MNKENDSFISSRKKPNIPKGWTIVAHVKIKPFFWNRKSAVLHREKEQENSLYLSPVKIYNRLIERKKIPLNATVLDFLLKHKKRIPKSWDDGRTITFPGTIYKDDNGCLRIPYLVRYKMRGKNGHWQVKFSWSFTALGGRDYIALLAE